MIDGDADAPRHDVMRRTSWAVAARGLLLAAAMSCGASSAPMAESTDGSLAVTAEEDDTMSTTSRSSSTSTSTSAPNTSTTMGSTAPSQASGNEPIRVQVRYGDEPQATGILSIPAGDGPIPIVVLIHGGFWRNQYGLDLMEPLAGDLSDRGVAVWNVDYRAVGDSNGGGWPGTLEDVGAAMDALRLHPDIVAADGGRLDLDNVVVVGHSAGGHLALWTASRQALLPGDPGADPAVVPTVVVAQAPVVDLVGAAGRGLGAGAVQGLLGGEPDEHPERYRVAQPTPADARIILVHGDRDDIVPPSEALMLLGDVPESIWAGFDETTLIEDPDAGHFTVIDPAHRMWSETMRLLGFS